MSTLDNLLPALRAVAEPTRLRLLGVLSHSELTVSEMAQLFGQSQPRLSHHLKTLCDAGLLERVQEGTSVFHRVPSRGARRRMVTAVLGLVAADDPTLVRDLAKLEELKKARLKAAEQYFRDHAERWGRIRRLYLADPTVEQALLEFAARNPGPIADFLDIGTGTGHVLDMLAERVAHGVGVDVSREMLSIARAQLESARRSHCHVRLADACDLPFADQSFDLVAVHHVLHFLEFPERAIDEAIRVLRLGGRLAVVDFAPHTLEHLRADFAHRRLGFADDEVIGWFRARGMGNVVARHFPGVDAGALRRPPATLWTATKAALPAEKDVRVASRRPPGEPLPAQESAPPHEPGPPQRPTNPESPKNTAKR